MKFLLGRVFLIVGFPLSLHLIYCSTSFWLAEFLLKSQLITLWDFPCKWLTFPLLILIVSLFLNSCHFTYNMSCVFFFGLILFGTLWFMDLRICFLSQVREIFSCYDFSYVLWPFLSLSLSPPSETPIMQILVHLIMSQKSLKLSSFLFIFFSVHLQWFPLF